VKSLGCPGIPKSSRSCSTQNWNRTRVSGVVRGAGVTGQGAAEQGAAEQGAAAEGLWAPTWPTAGSVRVAVPREMSFRTFNARLSNSPNLPRSAIMFDCGRRGMCGTRRSDCPNCDTGTRESDDSPRGCKGRRAASARHSRRYGPVAHVSVLTSPVRSRADTSASTLLARMYHGIRNREVEIIGIG